MSFGGAETRRRPISERRSRTEDDHDVGDADRTDDEGNGAESEKQTVEGTLRVGLGDEAADG